MPEQIIRTATPLRDAIAKVTNNGGLQWRFRDFTVNAKHMWNGEVGP